MNLNNTIMNKFYAILLSAIAIFCFTISCNENVDDSDCAFLAAPCEDTSFVINEDYQNRKVLIVGIDGFRSDAMNDSISPFLYDLSKATGTYYTGKLKVEAYTWSGTNWASILNGTHWCKHNVKDNFFVNHRLKKFPSIFKYIEEADESIQTAAVSHWLPITQFLTYLYADYAPYETLTDVNVMDKTIDIIENGNPIDADVVFVQLDDLDKTGHNIGFGPTVSAYRNTLTVVDQQSQAIYDAVEAKRNDGEDWLVVFVSDHGGQGRDHGNGQFNPRINQTILYMNHPSAEFLSDYTPTMADIAPTVMSFLGIESAEFNCKTDGVSLITGYN